MTIKPGDSPVYVRMLLALHLISAALILQSSVVWPLKLALVIFLFGNALVFKNKNPNSKLIELKLTPTQCVLTMKNGQCVVYDQLNVLIHNELFQLIQFTTLTHKKRLVLFNDQIPLDQLRLLHVRAGINQY